MKHHKLKDVLVTLIPPCGLSPLNFEHEGDFTWLMVLTNLWIEQVLGQFDEFFNELIEKGT